MEILSSFFCVTSLFLSVTVANDSPKVTITQGTLVGTSYTTRGGREVSAFLGVPYAAPPIGQLRFKSPQPPPSWKGERGASEEGHACIQQFVLIERLRNITMGEEDCLYLNVFTPKVSELTKLPVMFYIHGGSYVGGSGSPSNYGPELLLDRDVVLVTINYRLGPLGFLSTGNTVLPGNLGLKDQLAALKWVQQNIHFFGGNKEAVTLFGQSAGGASVHFHLLSPRSKGLFHAAVSQSGTALCPWALSSPTRHQMLATKLAQLTNCPFTSPQALHDCLMDLPAKDIVGKLKYMVEWDIDPVAIFNPAIESEDVEDAFLTEDPWTMKPASNVPWMLGFNEHDGAAKASSLTQGDVLAKFNRLNEDLYFILPMSLMYQFTAKDPDQVTKLLLKTYFADIENITVKNVPEIIKLYTDGWFAHGTLDAARRYTGPTFLYYFAYNNSLSFSICSLFFGSDFMGACHFDDLIYLFPMGGHAPKLVKDDPDFVISEKMVKLWTDFATNKVPSLNNSGQSWDSSTSEDYLWISQEGFKIHQNLSSTILTVLFHLAHVILMGFSLWTDSRSWTDHTPFLHPWDDHTHLLPLLLHH